MLCLRAPSPAASLAPLVHTVFQRQASALKALSLSVHFGALSTPHHVHTCLLICPGNRLLLFPPLNSSHLCIWMGKRVFLTPQHTVPNTLTSPNRKTWLKGCNKSGSLWVGRVLLKAFPTCQQASAWPVACAWRWCWRWAAGLCGPPSSPTPGAQVLLVLADRERV